MNLNQDQYNTLKEFVKNAPNAGPEEVLHAVARIYGELADAQMARIDETDFAHSELKQLYIEMSAWELKHLQALHLLIGQPDAPDSRQMSLFPEDEPDFVESQAA